MLTSLTMGPDSPSISITKRDGDVRHLPPKIRRQARACSRTHQPEAADPARSPADTDEFYDRLQGIWDQVMRFEDLGIIHNESDKFRYAYQLAEAELRELCTANATLHR